MTQVSAIGIEKQLSLVHTNTLNKLLNGNFAVLECDFMAFKIVRMLVFLSASTSEKGPTEFCAVLLNICTVEGEISLHWSKPVLHIEEPMLITHLGAVCGTVDIFTLV